MSAARIEIRRLAQGDAADVARYRDIRLEALSTNPEAFGSSLRTGGISRRLIEAILEVARQHVELIQLTVVQNNVRARRLYASLGFVDYGIERNALKQNGRYYDEVLMARDLLGEPD
jgi:RimJ/RimL family protein N-acetyltransferase